MNRRDLVSHGFKTGENRHARDMVHQTRMRLRFVLLIALLLAAPGVAGATINCSETVRP